MAQTVNITDLSLPQLEGLKSQLDQEVEFLSSSIAQLKVVQTKYVEAKECLSVLNKSNEGKQLLVPLTSSMYVPGTLNDVSTIMIDVGTGYYVEKTVEDAKDFFKRKVEFLTKQIEKIQPALQEKHAMKQEFVDLDYLDKMESVGDGLSVIRKFLDNGFPDNGSHTSVIEMMSIKIQQLTAAKAGTSKA